MNIVLLAKLYIHMYPICTARLVDWMSQGLGIPLTAS